MVVPPPTVGAQGSLAATTVGDPVFAIEGLSVSFRMGKHWVRVVDDVALTVGRGEILGLVGESGSGKTMTALGALGLVSGMGGRAEASSVRIDGREVSMLGERAWSEIRGRDVGMIFQQPIRSLNPAFTVGDQIAEVVRRHRGATRKAAWDRAVEMLDRVQIADAARRAKDYPHTFSGGMCQRVMIAMALACDPRLLIADEPTTALDVTVQARVLDVIRDLQEDTGISVLFITHDLGVVAEVCDRVAVMYAGQVIEEAAVEQLFVHPTHPYTEGLLDSIPKLGLSKRLESIPGVVPPPDRMPDGCRFHPRCAYVDPARCTIGDPAIEPFGASHSRCVRVAEVELRGVTVP